MELFFSPSFLSSEISRIEDNLYLSSIDPVLEPKTLKSHKIKRILTLDAIPIDPKEENITYMFIKVNDHSNEDLLSRFEDTYQFISEGALNGQRVLVHCLAGISRSATIVIAYLMVKNNMSFEEAMALVRKKRSIISPNYGFQKQLALFDKMGRRLDPSYGPFKQFLVDNLKYKLLANQPWLRTSYSSSKCDILEEYLKKRDDLIEKMANTMREEPYKCKKCRFFLFNQLNVIKSSEANVKNECQSLYIEPLQWMSQYLCQQMDGTINCPNCQSKLGHFNWNGIECDCDYHKVLGSTVIKLETKKVDLPCI